MVDETVRLRGNTFLLLLLRSASPNLSDQDNFGSGSAGLTRSNMFGDLIRIANPNQKFNRTGTLASYFSQYLAGDRPHSDNYYPFKSSAFSTVFKERMRTDYGTVLRDMDAFCFRYLNFDNSTSMSLLVAGLVLAIFNDPTIRSETKFFTGYGDVAKKDFGKCTNFILQPFLLSIWYYIIMNKNDASEGKETYQNWTASSGDNSPHVVITKIGSAYSKKIHVVTDISELTPDPDIPEEETHSQITPEESADSSAYSSRHTATEPSTEKYIHNSSQQGSDTYESEVIDDEEKAEKDAPNIVVQNVWNNNGDGLQIGVFNGTLNWGKGKES